MEEESSKIDTEREKENPYLKELREELKTEAISFRTGKEDSKVDKMFKLLNMIKLSSTIKILKDDYLPIEIMPHLYLGSIGCASNDVQLQKCKITHIVVCAKDIKNFFPNKYKYISFDILDSEKADIKQFFNESNKFIDDALKNNGNVLVHCHAGVSRSVTILMAYIMKSQKMSYDKVFSLVQSKRDKIKPNEGFIKQLKEYEKELGIQ